jgi:hypothetical protein
MREAYWDISYVEVMLMRRGLTLLLAALALSIARPASATFHLMQIEQLIGGVNGDTGAQAIQLRMRTLGQHLVSNARLRVWDATGSNPIIVMDPVTDVPVSAAGSHVLFATATFASRFGPTPDFIITTPIPDSYMAAGSLTWEDNAGNVYWRVSWGGAAYTGPGAGSVLNDPNGDFNPPFGDVLPTSGDQALMFTGVVSAQSSDNATNYQLTPGIPVFTNNNGDSAPTLSVNGPGSSGPGVQLGLAVPNPSRGVVNYSITLPQAMHVRVGLFDVSGRRVRTLVDEDRPAGQQALQWNSSRDGKQLPVGHYSLRLEAGGVTLTRRFVLLR